MTWETFHRRGDVLRNVISAADSRRDGTLPVDVPGVAETFRDDLDLVGALQLRWHTRLAGRIEAGQMDQPLDLETAVVEAWRSTADELPGVREILDRHRNEPTSEEMERAMRIATGKERQMLAVLAGLVSSTQADRFGAERGAELERRARAGHRPAPAASPERRCGNPAFLARLKAALAA